MDTMVDGIEANIAGNIRRRREELGLSLAELAGRSGVSKAMIAKVESRASSPTAGLLGRLCSGLGVTLSTLMLESERSGVTAWLAAAQPHWQDPETRLVRTLVAPATSQSPLEVARLTVPAGTIVTYDLASPWLRQHILMLAGRLAFTIGGERTELAAGDALFAIIDRPTRFEVLGDEPAEYFVLQEPG